MTIGQRYDPSAREPSHEPTPPCRRRAVPTVCRARDLAAANYTRPVTVADMAQAACLSPWHFQRLFAAAFGQTPHAFLSSLRLRQAKRLLASSELSVTEICLETGFSSLGSFSTWFRVRSGLAPSAYRRELTRTYGGAMPFQSVFVPTCFLAAFVGPE